MKKANKRFFIFLIALFSLMTISSFVLAAPTQSGDFLSGAYNWYKSGGNSYAAAGWTNLLSDIARIINVAGTGIIAIVAVVLGIKYMIGGVSEKASVKDQLITFLVACMFFFGWSSISGILISGTTHDNTTGAETFGSNGAPEFFLFKNLNGVDGTSSLLANIFALVSFIGKIIAFVAVMIVGVKYIFSGANGKAQLKQKGPMFILGILLIFCTLNVLSFIADIIANTF